MNHLKSIKTILKSDLSHYDKTMRNTLISDVKLINQVINYVTKKKGKQLRPILTLLAANCCGNPNKDTYYAAALTEIIHIATLVHDDIVDEADTRRGWPSAKRIWKNKISTLIGDFMFSKALTNMIHLKNFEALGMLSQTANRLSQGEILQIEKSMKKEMTEETYIKMVSDKTASLFSCACMLGALTVNADKKQKDAFKNFGEYFGLAFQMKDDLFDIMGKMSDIGKPTGFDVKKNMLTLPFIHLISTMDKQNKSRILSQLQYHAKRNELKNIRTMVESGGGIDYTMNKIKEISNKAENELSIFEDSIFKNGLLDMLKFNLNRTI